MQRRWNVNFGDGTIGTEQRGWLFIHIWLIFPLKSRVSLQNSLEQPRILLPYTPLCSVPIVPSPKFTFHRLCKYYALHLDCKLDAILTQLMIVIAPLFRSVCSTGQIHTATVYRTSLCESLDCDRIARYREDCRGSPDMGLGSGLQPEASNRNPGAIGVGTIPVQSVRNPPELPQDCQKSRIHSQSGGLQISRSQLRVECDHPKELLSGIAGHREVRCNA